MSNLYNQIMHFKDQVLYLLQNPGAVKTELANDHQLLVEVIGIALLLFLLLLALFKPTPTEIPVTLPTPKKAEPPSAAPAKKGRAEPQAWIKRAPPSIHELSLEEEQALNQAMIIAGKQALAEVNGAPHQAEFFQSNDAAEAAKKMFARQKIDLQNEAAAAAQDLSKSDFVILYFMEDIIWITST